MKIHLRQIPADGMHLEGEEPCPLGDLETEDFHCAGALRYHLDLGISEGALWASGSLVQPVELRCVACLENFGHDIQVPAFALHMELHGPETIDLTPAMREDLLLNLPAYPRCDREGDRVCSGATPTHVTESARQEEEAKREHDWEVLDKLKIKRK